MSFDPRIKNPKLDIISYLDLVSTTNAYRESLIGKRGFFANNLQEFACLRECHFKRLAYITLEADNGEYTAALHQTLAFAEDMAESAVRDRIGDSDFLQFMSMTVLYLSDLLEKVEAEDKKDKECQDE